MYKAKFNFISLATLRRTSREYETSDVNEFQRWINSYLCMDMNQLDLRVEYVSAAVQRDFKMPKWFIKRMV